MLLYTEGLERTVEEHESLLNRAGFGLNQIIPTDRVPSVNEGKCEYPAGPADLYTLE